MTSILLHDRRNDTFAPPSGVHFSVRSYSRMAVGGCDRAEIEVTGSRFAVYSALNWLRFGVDIFTTRGEWAWGGYISRVEVSDPQGQQVIEADLDTMINYCAVAYNLLAYGEDENGQRATTAWAENEYSIYEYGRRASLESANACNTTLAENARDRKLAERAYPTAQIRFDGATMAGERTRATLFCAGWWYSLDWLYCYIPSKMVLQFETIGTFSENLGEDHNDDAENISQFGQQFKSGTDTYDLVQAQVYVKRTGTPGDTLDVDICEDSDGEPGTSLGSGTIAAVEVGTDYAWTTITFSSAITLTANTLYWVVVSTDALASDAYYTLKFDINKGYADGVCKKYLDSAWADVNADMPFRLYADTNVDTAVQVSNIITAHGQFFKGVDLHVLSGIDSESFRNGDNDALYEAENLMGMGTGDNLRILAEVLQSRAVRIFEEPAQPSSPAVWRDGKFYTSGGAPMDPELCPVAFWAQSGVGLPMSVNASILSGLGLSFIERAEYRPPEKSLTWEPLVNIDRYDLRKQG